MKCWIEEKVIDFYYIGSDDLGILNRGSSIEVEVQSTHYKFYNKANLIFGKERLIKLEGKLVFVTLDDNDKKQLNNKKDIIFSYDNIKVNVFYKNF